MSNRTNNVLSACTSVANQCIPAASSPEPERNLGPHVVFCMSNRTNDILSACKSVSSTEPGSMMAAPSPPNSPGSACLATALEQPLTDAQTDKTLDVANQCDRILQVASTKPACHITPPQLHPRQPQHAGVSKATSSAQCHPKPTHACKDARTCTDRNKKLQPWTLDSKNPKP
jgi:hypothetical protein